MENQTKTRINRINNVEINGHLGSDPELFTTSNGNKKVRVSIAQNNYTSTGKQVNWFNVIGWGDVAERIAGQLRKGDLAEFKGRIQSREYKNNAGVTCYTTEIVVNSFTLATENELQKAG